MSAVRHAYLSIPKAARLLGLDRTRMWRKAKRGDFGTLPLAPGAKKRVVISVAALERYSGQTFLDEQLAEAALTLPASSTGRPAVVAQATIDAAMAKRDEEWRLWLRSPNRLRAAYPLGPPNGFSKFQASTFKGRETSK